MIPQTQRLPDRAGPEFPNPTAFCECCGGEIFHTGSIYDCECGRQTCIHCRHYKNSHEWLTTLAIPKATTSPRVNRVFLSEGQFQDRVQKQRRALLNTL